ncbi:hypothetical protein F5887DRAFT_1201345, partial [Amanita rubescens]
STTTNKKLPPWAPFAFIAGASAALIVPLFWLRRQRGRALAHQTQTTLAPTALSAVHFARGLRAPTTSASSPAPEPTESSSEHPSLFTALSHADTSTALFAAKAFGIATLLVALGGVGITWTVKTTMGVDNMHDFGCLAKQLVQTHLPSLSENLYRIPETPDEHISDPELENLVKQLDNELIQENKLRNKFN